MSDLKSAHHQAYELALQNAAVWLELANDAFDKEYYGHSFSMTVLANEEVVKAFTSWMVSQNYIPPEDERVKAAYSWHQAKGVISFGFHYQLAMNEMLRVGLLDADDLIKEIVTESPEQVEDELWNHAYEMEERRKKGVYVDIKETEDGSFLVTSPSDISRGRVEDFKEYVTVFRLRINNLTLAVQKSREARSVFERWLEEDEPN